MSASYREVEFLDPVFIDMSGRGGASEDDFTLHYNDDGYLIGIEIPATKITVKGFVSSVNSSEPQTANI